ncbi:hypothetical protein EDB83DRAFT_931133 [Lactarius deliciosus]|nr:hypothetical protein EDB83DRAFT_931133 [Lactarius deliciosus]
MTVVEPSCSQSREVLYCIVLLVTRPSVTSCLFYPPTRSLQNVYGVAPTGRPTNRARYNGASIFQEGIILRTRGSRRTKISSRTRKLRDSSCRETPALGVPHQSHTRLDLPRNRARTSQVLGNFVRGLQQKTGRLGLCIRTSPLQIASGLANLGTLRYWVGSALGSATEARIVSLTSTLVALTVRVHSQDPPASSNQHRFPPTGATKRASVQQPRGSCLKLRGDRP